MKGFNWAGDLNGQKNPIIRKRYVPDATAIEQGEPVIYTPGTGIAVVTAPADLDDPIDGVSLVEKKANDGVTEIDVSVSPTAIYKYKAAKTYTMTGGSATTCVDSSLLPATNGFWKGGAIKIISCAADSSLNGRIVRISDSTGATGTLTLAETLPAVLAAADTYQLCPGYMAENYLGYDLDADAMNPDYDANGGNVLRLHATNPAAMETYWIFERHANVS